MPDPAGHSVLRCEDVRALDAFTIASGIPGGVLMERAGIGIASFLEAFYEQNLFRISGRAPAVLVLAGAGSNGGDGYVVARLMSERGWSVSVGAVGGPPASGSDGAKNRIRWIESGGEILETEDAVAQALDAAGASADRRYDVVLDALLGTGLDREVGAPYRNVIEKTNASAALTVAVDIPSGLDCDSGRPLGVAIEAASTVTLGAGKPGLFLAKGPDYCGAIEVVDIGLADPDVAGIRALGRMLTACSVRWGLPRRRGTAHKGEGGHVLVLGGSLGKTGAVLLAARGALRAGAGLVTVSVPASLAKTTDAALWEAMVTELPDDGRGHTGEGAWSIIEPDVGRYTSVVLGPGLATGTGARELVFAAVGGVPCPLVLDADALNVLAADPEATLAAMDRRRGAGHADLLLTPHPGEMARLLGSSSAAVQGDRLAAVYSYLRTRAATTLVLKGAATIVAREDRLAFNTSGNPGMAAAGMGDVLSGIVAAMAGVVGDCFEAASVAVFVHGAAGDALAREIDGPGFFASELADSVPEVLAALRRADRVPG